MANATTRAKRLNETKMILRQPLLLIAIILSFATGGSVQDEEPNDSVFQMETIHSFDGRLRVDIDATEMMVRQDITD